MNINIYRNIYSTQVEATFNIAKWLDLIKRGSKHTKSIIDARKGMLDYKKAKNNTPCCTFNFIFNKNKTNDNIIRPTGYLYFDIDKEDFDISVLDTNKIFAYWHSFGGKGYTILVKVQGLTLQNYKSTIEYISKDLNIFGHIDSQARKATQFTILSYDPNLFFNNNSFVYNAVEQKSATTPRHHFSDINDIKVPLPIYKEEDKKINKSSGTFMQLKFKVLLDEYAEDCVYIPEGKPYYDCVLPYDKNGHIRKIMIGERHTILSIYMNNLLCLNPDMSAEQAAFTLRCICDKYCEDQVSDESINNIVSYKYKQRADGTLKPYALKIKKYWIDPNVKDKFDCYLNKRREPVDNALDSFFGDELLNIEHKITYKFIADFCGISERTVKRRLSDIHKELLNEHNETFLKKKRINNKSKLKLHEQPRN